VERIDSPQHPVFRACAELSGGLARAREAAFGLEGVRLVRQALAAGLLQRALVVEAEPDPELLAELAAARVPTWLLAPQLVPRLLGTGYDTHLGAFGVAARRPLAAPPAHGLVLAAESIQDPRNVGVLVRTAEAAGLAALCLSDHSADAWSRPAVRSSTGSILRQPVHLSADLPALLTRCRGAGFRVYATSARARRLVWDVDLRGDVILVVGNESEGLSPAARAAADDLVALPTHGGASSFNVTVAAGALVCEALRQRR